jgi:hypothetical protein
MTSENIMSYDQQRCGFSQFASKTPPPFMMTSYHKPAKKQEKSKRMNPFAAVYCGAAITNEFIP